MTRLPRDLQEAPDAYVIANKTHAIKTLGIKWHPISDDFKFTVQYPSVIQDTKRALLSEASKLFDPIGWISPVIIVFKVLLQECWITGTQWDEAVPDRVKTQWDTARLHMPCLQELSIPRCVRQDSGDIELHVFYDASEKAYAAAVYVKTGRHVRLLTAKTKVAPVQRLTLPRLELSAAALGAKLKRACQDAIAKTPYVITNVYGWSDSTIVLSWISEYPSTWTCFVGNRVASIQAEIPPHMWRHVPSPENPADCASRD